MKPRLPYTFRRSHSANVRFGSKADMCGAPTHVRFTPNSDRKSGHLLVGPSSTKCGPAMPRERASCTASSTTCWLHLSRGIDFGFLGDRLSICLICAGVIPRMPYPRRSSSAIASRLSSSTVFLRGAMMTRRIGRPEPSSLCQPSQEGRFFTRYPRNTQAGLLKYR